MADQELFTARSGDRSRRRSDDAQVIQALLALHRAVEERQGATVRGRAAAAGNRYLEAARVLGEELVQSVLGASKE